MATYDDAADEEFLKQQRPPVTSTEIDTLCDDVDKLKIHINSVFDEYEAAERVTKQEFSSDALKKVAEMDAEMKKKKLDAAIIQCNDKAKELGYSSLADYNARLKLAQRTRSFMELHGSREAGTEAAHAFPDYLLKQMIMNPKTNLSLMDEISAWTGSKENLTVGPVEVNKEHSTAEREMRKALPPGVITEKAMARAIHVAETVNSATSLSDEAKIKMIGRYVRYACSDEKTGRTNSTGQLVVDDRDMRLQRNRESMIVNALVKPTTPLVVKKNGKVSKCSPLVQNGDVLLCNDGTIHKSSKAVLSGRVVLNQDKTAKLTSEACKQSYVDKSDKNKELTHVKGFERKNGTVVRDFWREKPEQKQKPTLPPKPAAAQPATRSTYVAPKVAGKTFVEGFSRKDGTIVSPCYRPSHYNTSGSSSSGGAAKSSAPAAKSVQVSGYMRGNTHVSGYTRSAPSSSSSKSSGGGGKGGGGRKR